MVVKFSKSEISGKVPEESTLILEVPEFPYQTVYGRSKEALAWPDLSLGGRGRGPRPPTNRVPPNKPFIFYFSLMIDAHDTTT